jgi:hypothetical protein
MINTRPIIRATNALALAEGLTRSTAYRWLSDRWIQRAYFTPAQAREHVEWCKANSQAVRAIYTRDIKTGRFVAA